MWVMLKDFEHRYRAVRGRDVRFDGWFYVAVTSTGIYCRPSCPAATPRRSNVRFYPTAAAAQYAGFRACKRCRPDAVPGSPEWDIRTDLVARAMRLIADGVVDRDGVSGLARRLGYTERHLNRLLAAEVGAGPLALARARRAHTARLLIETTDLPITEVAFAAGFASVRQFNDTIREVFAATPRELRRARGASDERRAGGDPTPAAVQETVRRERYAAISRNAGSSRRRALRRGDLPADAASAARRRNRGALRRRRPRPLRAQAGGLEGPRYRGTALPLAPRPRRRPRRRRRRARGRPAARPARSSFARAGACRGAWTAPNSPFGPCSASRSPWPAPHARRTARRPLRRTAPEIARCRRRRAHASVSRAGRRGRGGTSTDSACPRPVRETLRGLARALARGGISLDPGSDREEVERRLLELRGIGPWTASYVAMRALGDPDAFLPSDLGVRQAIERLGHAGDRRSVAALAERWRPWRAYATQHLWASLGEEKIGSRNREVVA